MKWSARQYVSFDIERTRPVRDLLNAIPNTQARAVVDLGCGPGNSTEVLAARFPDAAVTGLDSSPDMIKAARQRLTALRFEVASIETWEAPGLFDAILANAVLQWVANHDAILPRLAGKLAPGGSLAVQMPDNLDEPAHRLMREVAAGERWADRLAVAAGARTTVQTADWYYHLLQPYGSRVDVWRTTYHHPLPGGTAAVVEWFKGSGLRPYLAALEECEQAAFLDRYHDLVSKAYPAMLDGTVLLPFPRLFIVVTR
jgi:trans-aconitate 2-methyltransferase